MTNVQIVAERSRRQKNTAEQGGRDNAECIDFESRTSAILSYVLFKLKVAFEIKRVKKKKEVIFAVSIESYWGFPQPTDQNNT